VEVVGHDDEGVEFVVSFGAVVLEGFDEEFGVAFDLEDAAAVVDSAGDEEAVGAGCAGGIASGDCNCAYLRGQSPLSGRGVVARLKLCP